MASSTLTFTITQRRLLTAVLLVLVACSAMAARYHNTRDSAAPAEQVHVTTTDYLLWHRQEAGDLELDSLNQSLRLFSTIVDKLASDASGPAESAMHVAHGTSSRSSQQHGVDR